MTAPTGIDLEALRKRHERIESCGWDEAPLGRNLKEPARIHLAHAVYAHEDRAALLALAASQAEQIAGMEETRDALLFALYDMRFMWGGHAEECAYVLDRPAYKAKCDCDWPIISKPADAAIIKAAETTTLDEAIAAVRAKRAAKAAYDATQRKPTDDTR